MKMTWDEIPDTLEGIEALPTEVLTCEMVCKVLHTDPNTLRAQAQDDPDRLDFPVIVVKRRVKIPKQPFLKYMRGEIGG